MRSIPVLAGVLSGVIAALAPGKDRAFVVLAGELQQITDACQSKAAALTAEDPVREVYQVYSASAHQHGETIQFTLSARNLQALIGLGQVAAAAARVSPSQTPKTPAPAPTPTP